MFTAGTKYACLKCRDRRVIEAGELSERPVDSIRNARIPDRFSDLNKEIKDRRPCQSPWFTPVGAESAIQARSALVGTGHKI